MASPMTLQEFGLQVKQQIYPGTYDNYPDEFVALNFLEKNPKYWNLVSPAARKIHDLMQRNNQPSYVIPALVSSAREASDEASISKSNASQAADLHSMELMMAAVSAGMTTDDYSLAQLEKFRSVIARTLESHSTDEHIRLAREAKYLEVAKAKEIAQNEAEIKLDKKRRQVDMVLEGTRKEASQKFVMLDALRDHLFAAYDQRRKIQTEQLPGFEEKLKLMNETIDLMEKDFYGRFSREFTPEEHGKEESEGVDEDPED